MAHSRAWDADRPSGAIDASLIDDEIRILRQDVAERLMDISGASNMSGDPFIPALNSNSTLREELNIANAAIGQKTAQKRTIGCYAGYVVSQSGAGSMTSAKYAISGADGSATIAIPIVLPAGVTITGFAVTALYQSENHDLSALLKVRNGDSEILNASITDITHQVATVQKFSRTGLTQLIDVDQHIFVEVTLDNNDSDTGLELAVFQVEVTFTHPGAGTR